MHASLSGRTRFDAVLRHGVRFRRGGVTVIGMERPDGPARVGLVVGRRAGRAVKRNRVKRRLRAALNEVGLRAGFDYVVIGSSAVAGVPFRALCGWLEEAISATSAEGERSERN